MFKYILPVLLLLCVITPSIADEANSGRGRKEISPEEIIAYVRYLSSGEFEGRMTGEKGCEMAADYIARHFKESGIEPFGDKGTYFQNFKLPERVVPGKSNSLTIITKGRRERLEMKRDFFPLDISPPVFLLVDWYLSDMGSAPLILVTMFMVGWMSKVK